MPRSYAEEVELKHCVKIMEFLTQDENMALFQDFFEQHIDRDDGFGMAETVYGAISELWERLDPE